jgi:uncharacterized SAM-binding protein YcdF (DUF218 family)
VAGAIIVLGGDVARGAGGPEIGRFTLERLRRGAALHRATGLPLLVAGGKLAPGEPPLARLMADSLVADFGVPVRWREEASRTTGENAIQTAALLRAAGIGSAYLVTHAWHLRRAQAEFVAAGITVLPVPVGPAAAPRLMPADLVPRADRLAESWWAIREWAGLLVRRLAP